MIMKRMILVLTVAATLSFFGCDSSQNSAADNNSQATAVQPSEKEVSAEAKNMAIFTVRLTTEAINAHKELIAQESGLAKTNNPDKVYRWNPETMWHTWTHNIEGENLKGMRFRAQQHINAEGEVVKKASAAIGFRLYYISEGKYGYPDGDPTGTSWKQVIGSEEAPIQTAVIGNEFIFSGKGSYNKTWDGYFSEDGQTESQKLVKLSTDLSVNIENLTVTTAADGTQNFSLKGKIDFDYNAWNVSLSCDGSDTMVGTISKDGTVLNNINYSVAKLASYINTLQ